MDSENIVVMNVCSVMMYAIIAEKFRTSRKYKVKLMGSKNHDKKMFGKCAGGHVFDEERHQFGVRT